MNIRLITCWGAFLSVAGLAQAGPHVGIGVSIGIPAPIIVREAPPRRVVEKVYTSPGPGYVWVSGHYTWVENRWVWLNGAWTLPPQPNAYWVDGRWTPDTHQWVEAHWEAPAPPPPPPSPPASQPPSAPPGTNSSSVPLPTRPAPVIAEPSEIIVEEAPPPPVREVIVASPGRGYVWVGGYWGWEHGRREWVHGYWARPPHRHAVWIAPRWESRGHGYVYVRGFWR